MSPFKLASSFWPGLLVRSCLDGVRSRILFEGEYWAGICGKLPLPMGRVVLRIGCADLDNLLAVHVIQELKKLPD